MFRITKGLVALALAGALVGGTSQAAISDSDRRSAKSGARYLVNEQKRSGKFPGFSEVGSTADAVVSLVAARRGPKAISKAYGFLERNQADISGVGLTAKVIMALTATGRDPRSFEGRDLVTEITSSEQASGQYGEGTAVFDQALALLALVSADEEPSQAAETWLADAQCGDGGWEYLSPPGEGDDQHCYKGQPDDYFTSDTNTTGYAVQALEAAAGNVPLDGDPLAYLTAARDDRKNGWGYVPNSLTDANSTSLVIQAFVAAGEEVPAGAKKALRALQWRACEVKGGFAYTWQDEDGDGELRRSLADVGATIAALPALLEKPFPIVGSLPAKNPQPLDCQA